jgi:hypothetical protein
MRFRVRGVAGKGCRPTQDRNSNTSRSRRPVGSSVFGRRHGKQYKEQRANQVAGSICREMPLWWAIAVILFAFVSAEWRMPLSLGFARTRSGDRGTGGDVVTFVAERQMNRAGIFPSCVTGSNLHSRLTTIRPAGSFSRRPGANAQLLPCRGRCAPNYFESSLFTPK